VDAAELDSYRYLMLNVRVVGKLLNNHELDQAEDVDVVEQIERQHVQIISKKKFFTLLQNLCRYGFRWRRK
jgi:hypothetical protein